jgi:hypothetical protein
MIKILILVWVLSGVSTLFFDPFDIEEVTNIDESREVLGRKITYISVWTCVIICSALYGPIIFYEGLMRRYNANT